MAERPVKASEKPVKITLPTEPAAPAEPAAPTEPEDQEPKPPQHRSKVNLRHIETDVKEQICNEGVTKEIN